MTGGLTELLSVRASLTESGSVKHSFMVRWEIATGGRRCTDGSSRKWTGSAVSGGLVV
ncbi:hypothetical protein BJY18_000270 [Amycolatopsis jiangsuensis]|uniref:Uncharacterized protein n=1 Tax=Amycolatopsis jiangsuensis TaxID=1181879 RepID=A0A840IMU2_9PSEU|nr:hypothetical protein [Amycolatopsis jiangsuensis]